MFGITELLSAGVKILDKFIPDPAQKAAAIQALKSMEHDELMAIIGIDRAVIDGQNAANTEQAKSSSVWVAGARPFFMWVCGSAFALHFVLLPLAAWACAALGHGFPEPVFDMDSLMTVTMGMLGLGGMRTAEKWKGVAR